MVQMIQRVRIKKGVKYMFREYYDNGMVKLSGRIEDEFWYSDYQVVVELITRNDYSSLGEFIEASINEIKEYREVPSKMEIAIHLWCVLHWERKQNMPDFKVIYGGK